MRHPLKNYRDGRSDEEAKSFEDSKQSSLAFVASLPSRLNQFVETCDFRCETYHAKCANACSESAMRGVRCGCDGA